MSYVVKGTPWRILYDPRHPAPARCCGCASAIVNPVGTGVDKITTDSTIDQVLIALHDAGADLKNFDASVSMRDFDPLTGESTTRQGDVWYQRRDGGSDRMRVVFPTVVRGERKFADEKIEYKLEDGWLWDRTYKNKTEVKRQVLKPGQKINVLKLGEGPFPLPIGQDPAGSAEAIHRHQSRRRRERSSRHRACAACSHPRQRAVQDQVQTH